MNLAVKRSSPRGYACGYGRHLLQKTGYFQEVLTEPADSLSATYASRLGAARRREALYRAPLLLRISAETWESKVSRPAFTAKRSHAIAWVSHGFGRTSWARIAAVKLTDMAVRKASKNGLHSDGAGLYLSVTPRKDVTRTGAQKAAARRRTIRTGSCTATTAPERSRDARMVRALLRTRTDNSSDWCGSMSVLVSACAKDIRFAALRVCVVGQPGWE